MNILRPADKIEAEKGKEGATLSLLLLLKIIYCQQSEVDVTTFSESLVSGDLKEEMRGQIRLSVARLAVVQRPSFRTHSLLLCT